LPTPEKSIEQIKRAEEKKRISEKTKDK